MASRQDVPFMRKHTLTAVYESLQAHQYMIVKKKPKRQYHAQNCETARLPMENLLLRDTAERREKRNEISIDKHPSEVVRADSDRQKDGGSQEDKTED